MERRGRGPAGGPPGPGRRGRRPAAGRGREPEPASRKEGPGESGEAVLGQKDLGVCTTKSPGTPQKSPGSPNGGWWWFFADKQVE